MNEELNKNQEVQDLQQEPNNEVADDRRQQLAKQGFGGIIVIAAVLVIIFFVFSKGGDSGEEVKEEEKATPVVEKINLDRVSNSNPFGLEPEKPVEPEKVKNPFFDDDVKLIKGLSGGSVKGRQTVTSASGGGGATGTTSTLNDRMDAIKQMVDKRKAELEQQKGQLQNGFNPMDYLQQPQASAAPRVSGNYETGITESTAAIVTAKKSPLDPNLSIDKGTFIPCVLKTAIVSSLAGNIACIITNDVYSAGGTVLLIEKGSVVQGSFRSGMIQPGMNRLFVIWEDIKTPSRVIINVSAPSTDPLGGSGIEGWVDNHYLQRFGGAILLSMIDDAFSAAFDNKDGRDYTINTRENTIEMANIALQNSINIAPTLYKNQGDIVGVYVNKDIDFREVYRLIRADTRIQK